VSSEYERYRNRLKPRQAPTGKNPLKRWRDESSAQIVCPYCYSQRNVWYPRIPVGSPPQDCTRLILCPVERCGVQLYVYVSDEWRQRAEDRRPWQQFIDGHWLPGAPEPARPTGENPPPITDRVYIVERDMHARHGYYMLTNRTELAAIITDPRTEQTDHPWPGASEEVATLLVLYPKPGPDRDALRARFEIGDDKQEGDVITLPDVPRRLDPDCWWPLSGQRATTHQHSTLEQHADALTPATLQAAEVPEPRALEPDPEPHSAAVEAWLDEHADEVIDAVEVEPDADEEPTITVAGLADLEGEVIAEWAADDDTQPGIDTGEE
jgi:hypothetical protein